MNTKTKQGGLGIVSIPVSYTHLDVYKRQSFTRTSSPVFVCISVCIFSANNAHEL